MTGLPPGFVLDEEPPASAGGLPPGFVLDDDGSQAPQAGDRSVFKSGPASPVPTTQDRAEDLIKSAGAGVGKGAIILAGAVPDAREFSGDVATWAASKLGASPETAKVIADAVRAGFLAFPGGTNITSDQALKIVNDTTRPAPTPSQVAAGEQPRAPLEYEPRTTEGQVVEKIGEFAPSVALGPGGAIRKAAMSTVPAVAAVAAKNVAEGTAFEPYAEPVATILAGAATAGGKGSLVKEVAKGAPTREAVQQATNAAFEQLRAAGITYSPMAFENAAIDIMGQLKKGGFRKAQAPLTADAVAAIGEQLQRGAPDYNDLESIRRTTSAILRERNATDADKHAAGIVLDVLDNFMSNGKFVTNGKLTPAQAGPLMKEARELGRRNILAKQIEEMFAKAETYQSGFESGLRNQFSNYLRSNKAKGLTKEERQAFIEAAKGTFTNNAMGTFGKLGVDFSNLGNRASLLPTGVLGGGWLAGEPLVGASVTALATGARYAAQAQTRQAANRAMGTVLAGKEGQKAAAGSLRAQQIDVLLRRLIAGENAALVSPQLAPNPTKEPQRENR